MVTSTWPGRSPSHCRTRYAAVAPAARLSMPTYAARGLLGRSVTRVTTGMPAAVSRPTAAVTSGTSGALRITPCEPRLAILSRSFTSSGTGAVSRKWKRERTTAGCRDGSSASSASRTADENRCGVCMTMSIMKVRPPIRTWARCRSRSLIAWCTSRTVLSRTPPRLLRTRSTVASLKPA